MPLSVRVFHVDPPRSSGSRRRSTSARRPTRRRWRGSTVSRSHAERRAAHDALFRFLAEYGISPSSWGFGEPRLAAGYQSSSGGGSTRRRTCGRRARRLPVDAHPDLEQPDERRRTGSRASTPAGRRRGATTSRPCEASGSSRAGSGACRSSTRRTSRASRSAARRAPVEGAAQPAGPAREPSMTGNPAPSGGTASCRTAEDGDDVDVWVVLAAASTGSSRCRAARAASGSSRATIQGVRRAASIWSYTYGGVPGHAGLRRTEPLSNPACSSSGTRSRDCTASSTARARRATTRRPVRLALARRRVRAPLPWRRGPIPSARLEQIRDGIEDWALFELVRRSTARARCARSSAAPGSSARTRGRQARLHDGLRAADGDEVLVAAVVAGRLDRGRIEARAPRSAAARGLTRSDRCPRDAIGQSSSTWTACSSTRSTSGTRSARH